MLIIEKIIDQLSQSTDQEFLINGTLVMIRIDSEGISTACPSPYYSIDKMYEDIQEFGISQRVRLDPLRPSGGGVVEAFSNLSIRWHCILPPVSECGPLFSLRRIPWKQLTLSDFGFADAELKWILANCRDNCVFVSGATGSGKSTLLSILMEELLFRERVFVLETIAELPISHPPWVRLVEQVANLEGLGSYPLSQILTDCLRMRPDHFVLGEVRGVEARSLYQVLLSSYQSVWSTIHVDSPNLLVSRLSDLSGLSDIEWRKLFSKKQPVYIHLTRKKPRLAGLYRFENNGFCRLFSAKDKL